MRKNVSLKDIANIVGTSVSSVSYVLNGHAKEKRVGDAVAKKIFATAKKLRYHPNQIAKSLKLNKTHTIGLIVAEIHYPFTIGVTRAIEFEAKKGKYTVIIGNAHEDISTLSELIQALVHRQVDGLIIVGVENAEAEIKNLKFNEIPFVLIDRNFPKVKTNFIGIDNYKVAYEATAYLIKRKFKNIAFVNYKSDFFHLQERKKGYMQALKDHGLPANTALIKQVRQSFYDDDIKRAITELTFKSSKCDSIFFATGPLAVSGLKQIIDLKIKVPADISIISFDDSEGFALFECPITHFNQPLEEIGIAAVSLLFEVMKDNRRSKQIYLESGFVAGRSCGE